MIACSTQNVAVALFVKAHQQGFTYDCCGCAQITRTAEHCVYRFVRGVLAAFELGDFFTPGYGHRRGLRQQRKSVLALQLATRWNGFLDRYLTCFQELGCFGAAGSAAAKVIPVYFFCHG